MGATIHHCCPHVGKYDISRFQQVRLLLTLTTRKASLRIMNNTLIRIVNNIYFVYLRKKVPFRSYYSLPGVKFLIFIPRLYREISALVGFLYHS